MRTLNVLGLLIVTVEYSELGLFGSMSRYCKQQVTLLLYRYKNSSNFHSKLLVYLKVDSTASRWQEGFDMDYPLISSRGEQILVLSSPRRNTLTWKSLQIYYDCQASMARADPAQ